LLKQIKEHSTQEVAEVIDPFTDEKWTVLKPLRPDIAVIQVQIADEDGNAVILGPRWDNAEQARASQHTIVITEHVVPSDMIRHQPERTVIPGLLVSHVVELPFSAHPTSVYREYDYDAPQIQAYVEATCNPDILPNYLEKTVFGIANHNQYLEKIVGLERLEDLRADKILGY
jgi:acyl CoA:acetate/3-ketoacid CoA transferase